MYDNYLVSEIDAGPEDVVEVKLSAPANVMLLTASDYTHYRNNEQFNYYGGHSGSELTVDLTPPNQGHWYLVVDLGGRPGRVSAYVSIKKTA
jgi:hypothetical protein